MLNKGWAQALLIILNIAPLLIFAERFIPKDPIELWRRTLEGGPEQKRAREIVGTKMRLTEDPNGRRNKMLPGNTAIYYNIHTLITYTGLIVYPNGRDFISREANYFYTLPTSSAAGEFIPQNPIENVRFSWAEPNPRTVQIEKETLNTITLQISAGPAGKLIRTDTYYPGWHVMEPKGMLLEQDSSGFHCLQVTPEQQTIVLRYQPRWHHAAILSSSAGIVGSLFLGCGGCTTLPKERLNL